MQTSYTIIRTSPDQLTVQSGSATSYYDRAAVNAAGTVGVWREYPGINAGAIIDRGYQLMVGCDCKLVVGVAPQKFKPTQRGTGWCARCQSYCYGDCTA